MSGRHFPQLPNDFNPRALLQISFKKIRNHKFPGEKIRYIRYCNHQYLARTISDAEQQNGGIIGRHRISIHKSQTQVAPQAKHHNRSVKTPTKIGSEFFKAINCSGQYSPYVISYFIEEFFHENQTSGHSEV